MKAIKVLLIIIAFYTAYEGARAITALYIVHDMEISSLEAKKTKVTQDKDIEEFKTFLRDTEKENLEVMLFDIIMSEWNVTDDQIELLNQKTLLYQKLSLVIGILIVLLVVISSFNKPLLWTRKKPLAEE